MSARLILCAALAACGGLAGGVPAPSAPDSRAPEPSAPSPRAPAAAPGVPAPTDLPRGSLARGVATLVWEGSHGASGLPTATLLVLEVASGKVFARESWVARPPDLAGAAPLAPLERLAQGTGLDPATLRAATACTPDGDAAWRCGAHRVTVTPTDAPAGDACPEGTRPRVTRVTLDGTPLPLPVRVDRTCAVDAVPAGVLDVPEGSDGMPGAAVVVLREAVPRHEGVGTAWAFALRAGAP